MQSTVVDMCSMPLARAGYHEHMQSTVDTCSPLSLPHATYRHVHMQLQVLEQD